MATAGASAQREFERRQGKDRERRRRNRTRHLTIVATAPFVTYAVVRLLLTAINSELYPRLVESVGGTASSTDIISSAVAHRVALALAVAATVRLALEAWGSRPTTRSWGVGAAGERATGTALDALPSGFVVLHDRRMPGSRANIDHLVVGPTGVFTVETKNYSSPVVIRHGQATLSRRTMAPAVEQATKQAQAVTERLDTEARPIICVQGPGIEIKGLFQKPIVDGVRFCSGRRVQRLIAGLDEALSSAEVQRLAALADELFPSVHSKEEGELTSGERRCRCGAAQILRHRKTDGAPFWGCTRFPSCRHTQPV